MHKCRDLWRRFSGRRDGTLWYYRECLRALESGWDHPVLRELREAVGRLEALTARPAPQQPA